MQTAEEEKIVGLGRKTGRKDPSCISSISTEDKVNFFFFFKCQLSFLYFKNYYIVGLENENLWDLVCLFKEKIQAVPFKPLDSFGSVTCCLRECMLTDERPCGCPQPAGTMLPHPWHVAECAPQLFSISS